MSAPEPHRRMRDAGIVLALAVAFGLLEAAQGRLLYREIPWRAYWPEAIWRTMPSWLLLAALVPGIALLSRTARVSRETWRTAVPLHVAGGLAFTLLHLGGSAWAAALRGALPVQHVFEAMVSRYVVADLFTYGAIAAAFHAHHFQAEARARAVAASELQTGLVRARLRFLRAQLEPHFLFNALNSISSLALNGERERVAQTVSSLSALLRRSLDESDQHEVALATELALLEHYLDVERVRFGDRLIVERRVDPEVLEARVPSLLLQTLVENAVRHGIEARRGPGRVVIEAAREGVLLRLEVRDSGPGFGPDVGRTHDAPGVGLANSVARLGQLYGDAAVLECGAAPEGGGRVTVRLPFTRVGDPASATGVAR